MRVKLPKMAISSPSKTPKKGGVDFITSSQKGIFTVSEATDAVSVLYKRSSSEWERLGRRHVLKLFHAAAQHVPAYKDFLKRHKCKPEKVSTWEDFRHVPPVTKKNYLRRYPLDKLCWNGTLNQHAVIGVTSGSSGKPFYFPRNDLLDWQSSIMHEMFLKNSGLDPKKSTLVIVGFGMGVWIGGLITYSAFKLISQRGYPLTILTPGPNKQEIYEALRNIGNKYDQIILCGYPPFIKDVIDEGYHEGINWKRFNLRIVFAAEAFTEKFRDFIIRKTGIDSPYHTMNIYGTADLGTMAEETPMSILFRRQALADSRVYTDIFAGAGKLPTLAQFNPLFTHFDTTNGEILCSANNGIPLIRYMIGDHGGVASFEDLRERLRAHNVDIKKEMSKAKLDASLAELPFVYVYERSDFSTKLYGVIIYTEHVREALQDDEIQKFLTGKFTMITQFDRYQNEHLEIHVELKPRIQVSLTLKKLCERSIVKNLVERNAEYRNNFAFMPEKVKPYLIFWPYEHPLHFKPGIKQKWVKKVT